MVLIPFLDAAIAALAVSFAIHGAIAWGLSPSSVSELNIDREWDRLRRTHSKTYRLLGGVIARVGVLFERLASRKPIYIYWTCEGRIVPMPKHLYAGHCFVIWWARSIAGVLLVQLLRGSLNLFVAAFFATLLATAVVFIKLKIAEKQFVERLSQLRADLSFAIDLIALFDSKLHQLPVRHAIKAVASEFSDCELGIELSIVDSHIEKNCSLPKALTHMAHRWGGDDQVQRFVELVSAKDDGSASEDSLRNLAREISGDRQRALIAKSETAQRKLSLSNILFTYACILILIAPFIMKVPEMLEALK